MPEARSRESRLRRDFSSADTFRGAPMPSVNQLSKIQHVVVLMLENRSFDHMLGFLYADQGNKSPAGQPFEGLTGKESTRTPTASPFPSSRSRPPTRTLISCRAQTPARATPPPTPNSSA